jgi:hypothetical protein
MPLTTILAIAVVLVIYLKATKRQRKQINYLALLLGALWLISQFVNISFAISL